MTTNPVVELKKDPVILNIAIALPIDFSFNWPGRMINGEYYARDRAMEMTNFYVNACREEDRTPVTDNPSAVRWAIEELRSRWASILGWREEIVN